MTAPTPTAVRSAAAYLDSWWSFRQSYLRIPGVQAALLLDDELVLSGAYGSADVERGTAMTSEHLFRIASHSKTFTATAILQLAEAGRLRLDDRVEQWLPALASSPVGKRTLRDLLSHAGGVVRDGVDGDHWQLVRAPLDEAALLAVATAPGADVLGRDVRFKYSNIGYALLGLVIAAVTGRPYGEHVAATVVQPLGLRRTFPDLDPARAEECAVGYSGLGYADVRVPIDHIAMSAMASAAGFSSTAEDLCRYAAAHFSGDVRLLTDESKRTMRHEWWRVEGDEQSWYGLGFAVSTAGERRLVGHGGGYPGHSTRTLFDPEDRLAVSVLTNAIDGPAQELANGAVRLVDLATDGEQPADADLDRFTGRFANLWGVLDVAQLGGRLRALDPTAPDPAQGPFLLEVLDERTLRFADGPGYGSVGETLQYAFATDGSVLGVRGGSGMSWWPIADFTLPERVSSGSLRPPIG